MLHISLPNHEQNTIKKILTNIYFKWYKDIQVNTFHRDVLCHTDTCIFFFCFCQDKLLGAKKASFGNTNLPRF